MDMCFDIPLNQVINLKSWLHRNHFIHQNHILKWTIWIYRGSLVLERKVSSHSWQCFIQHINSYYYQVYIWKLIWGFCYSHWTVYVNKLKHFWYPLCNICITIILDRPSMLSYQTPLALWPVSIVQPSTHGVSISWSGLVLDNAMILSVVIIWVNVSLSTI